MLKKRIIPCLDVKDGRVVKGINFVDLIDAGDPVEQASIYNESGADEICFLDITASSDKRDILFTYVNLGEVEYLGMDISLEYQLNYRSSIFSTYSYYNTLKLVSGQNETPYVGNDWAWAELVEDSKDVSAYDIMHFNAPNEKVSFGYECVHVGETTLTFESLIHEAYMHRVSLSATGFYATPKIGYDRRAWQGRPFFYYACGAALSEVVVDTLTGEYRFTDVQIVHDCGRSLNPAIDLGQIEGGYLQGLGWLTSESLWFDERGALRSHAPSTYKIPACGDWPENWSVKLYAGSPNAEQTVYRSKAVGEPPLMLAISAFLAVKDAVSAVGQHRVEPQLDAPATPEAVLNAIELIRSQDTHS